MTSTDMEVPAASEPTEIVEAVDLPTEGQSEAGETDFDLDDLLAEFVEPDAPEETEPAEPKTESVSTDEMQAIKDFIAQQQRAEAVAQIDADIDSAVGFAADQLSEYDIANPEKTLRGLLYERYYSDPNFERAFNFRQRDPEGWQHALNRAVKELKRTFDKPIDREATADRAAIAAAVRGQSVGTVGDDGDVPADIGRWSNARFEQWVASHRK